MKITSFIASLSSGLSADARYRKSQACSSLLNSLSRFRPGVSLSLKAVFAPAFLRDYARFLHDTGCNGNTISFYVSALRSVYGEAVAAGRLPFVPDLFSGISIDAVDTPKRATGPNVVARILVADLSCKPRLEPCRDYLFLSLQLQGMSFSDLAHLQKVDIQGDAICYRRRKTGTPVRVALLPEVKVLFEKYADQVVDSPYLLPLVTLEGKDGYRQYQSALHRQNRQLKELAAHLGIQENLTTYTARHTWATLAYHNGVDVGVVGQGMGHHTEEVTRIYLDSFHQDRLMEANYVVLNAILRPVLEGRVDVCPETMARVKRQAAVATDFLAKSARMDTSMGVARLSVGKGGRGQRGAAGRGSGRMW